MPVFPAAAQYADLGRAFEEKTPPLPLATGAVFFVITLISREG
jgi:hypothetical protein